MVLRDFDAYNHVNLKLTPYEVMKHPTKKFGHGFVLMFMLLGLLDEKGNFIKDKPKKEVKFFAYPFGEYDANIVSVVKEVGYKGARSIDKGTHNTQGDIFTLKGIEVTDNFEQFVKDMNE